MLFNKPLVTLFEMFIYQMLFTNVFLLLVLSLVGHAQRACERTNNKKRLGYTYVCIRLQPLLVETGQLILMLLLVVLL